MENYSTKTSNNKKAVLFYNKIPFSFSEYLYYNIGSGYIALGEKTDNACVLCRVLSEKEIPIYEGAIHKLVTFGSDNQPEEKYVVIIKRELRSIEEATAIINKYATVKYSYQNMRVFEY